MDNKTIRTSVEIWLNGSEIEKNELITTYGHISEWDVSKVTDMGYLFYRTLFNENINNWDVSNVTNMEYMFYGAESFNNNINNWIVLNVTSMRSMFNGATSFNQNINNWDVSNVNDVYDMFKNASSFKQNIFSWIVNIKCSKNEFINMLKEMPFIKSLNITNEMFNCDNLKPLEIKKKTFNKIFNWEENNLFHF